MIRVITINDFRRFVKQSGYRVVKEKAINTHNDQRHGKIITFLPNLRATFIELLVGAICYPPAGLVEPKVSKILVAKNELSSFMQAKRHTEPVKYVVNEQKSRVVHVEQCSFLGFTLWRSAIRWTGKAFQKFMRSFRELTGRSWRVMFLQSQYQQVQQPNHKTQQGTKQINIFKLFLHDGHE